MSAHIMKSVGSRKEKPMLLQKLRQRLKDEYIALCTYLTTAPMTASDFDGVEWVLFDAHTEAVYEAEVDKLYK